MKAKFVSVWDGGHRIETDCQYDPATLVVSDIEVDEDCDDVETLETEFIELLDRTILAVKQEDGVYRVV